LAAGQPAYIRLCASAEASSSDGIDSGEEVERMVQMGCQGSLGEAKARQGAEASAREWLETRAADLSLPTESGSMLADGCSDASTEPSSPPPPPPTLPSVGALLHGTGSCRPCAWLWKPQGCANGSHCQHCHACPAGEIKARKKARFADARLDRGQSKLHEVPVAVAMTARFAVGGA